MVALTCCPHGKVIITPTWCEICWKKLLSHERELALEEAAKIAESYSREGSDFPDGIAIRDIIRGIK